MIEKKITNNVFLEARKKAVSLGKLRNSISNGGGNLAGFIGEFLVHQAIGGDYSSTYDYDILLGDKKIDVKTKLTSVEPRLDYSCSVSAYRKQNCDIYFFVRVKNDYSVAWLLGWIEAEEYFNKSVLLKKGYVDPTNKFKVKSDTYNLPISTLNTNYDKLISIQRTRQTL